MPHIFFSSLPSVFNVFYIHSSNISLTFGVEDPVYPATLGISFTVDRFPLTASCKKETKCRIIESLEKITKAT